MALICGFSVRAVDRERGFTSVEIFIISDLGNIIDRQGYRCPHRGTIATKSLNGFWNQGVCTAVRASFGRNMFF